MEQEISPIIHPNELVLLKQHSAIVLIDTRAGADAKEKYASSHLEGALHVDLDSELANTKTDPSNGGRHPLPEPAQFARLLSQLGITPASHVIVYDDKSGVNAAARFWWMLKSFGHEKIQVVDGGFDAAMAAGFPTSSNAEHSMDMGAYVPTNWQLPLSDINEVEKAVQHEQCLVIDVRDKERFNGEKEPIDLVAGHIPGAVNIPFAENLDEKGFFLFPADLKTKYLQVLKGRDEKNVIVHCGSGVTACHTLLAMAYAGFKIPKLYVGSWSEWSRTNRPVATI
ncbi:MAG: sulfurtransferase [Ferruginibacter sp.]